MRRGDYRNYYKGHMDKIKGEGGGIAGRWVQLGLLAREHAWASQRGQPQGVLTSDMTAQGPANTAAVAWPLRIQP